MVYTDSSLREAIARLNIPTLWERLGLPGHITKHCCVCSPLRETDRNPSFSVFADGTRWKDHGTGQSGDSFDLFQAIRKIDAKGAWHPFLELAGVLPESRNPRARNHLPKFMDSFDWTESVSNFPPSEVDRLAAERGINGLTIEGLRERGWIGRCYVPKWKTLCVAFPIADKNGIVYRAHCRSPQSNDDGKWDWAYEPEKDPLNRPIPALVIGQLATAHTAHIVESQWDGIALIDRLDLIGNIDAGEVCVVATRGAEFGSRLATLKWPAQVTIYAWPQNDKPGQKWIGKVVIDVGGCYVVEVPRIHKDLGEWIRNGGALAADIEATMDHARRENPRSAGIYKEIEKDEPPPCPFDPVDWDSLREKVVTNPRGLFVQQAIFPSDSVLAPYMDEARKCCESADIYLLGAILPVCGSLLARRVYAEWGMEKLYPNLFELLIGSAGMRKTSAVRCAKRVAWNCLPPEAFLSLKQSVEGLFTEYCAAEGGCPDKVMLVEEGNTLMATWSRSDYGALVAAEFLGLYDCAELTESFIRNRNKSKKSGTKRVIPETSTNVIIGGTFKVATFPLEQVKEGMARRFMYGVAEKLGRTIYWPERLPSFHIADLFKPLLALSGEIQMPRKGPVWDRWVVYQDQNRNAINEIGTSDEVLAARLTSTPAQVIKVAMIYEACRAVYHAWPALKNFTLEGLESAIGFVDEHLRAAEFLDQHGVRKAAQEQAEVVLATVRRDLPAQRPDTVYLTRTELTRRFCMNTGRHGAMTVEDLYLRIIPELERQGEATRVLKRGKFEVYGFRTEFGD